MKHIIVGMNYLCLLTEKFHIPDVYNIPGHLFFLEICPFGTSLLSTGRLFILMCCPTGTFIGSGLLLDPQEYLKKYLL